MAILSKGKEVYSPEESAAIDLFLAMRLEECERAIASVKLRDGIDAATAHYLRRQSEYWQWCRGEIKRCLSLLEHAKKRWEGYNRGGE